MSEETYRRERIRLEPGDFDRFGDFGVAAHRLFV